MRAAAVAAAACLTVTSVAIAQAPGAPDVVRTEPGAAAPAVIAHAPTPAASVLSYVAVGLAGLGALLGGGALAAALASRARLDELKATMDARPAADPRTAERLSHLEAAVRDLAMEPVAAAPRRTVVREAPSAAAVRDAFPPAPASADPTMRLSTWLEGLASAFGRLAQDPSSAAAAFIAEHRPRGALAGPGGVALLDGFEGAKLWAVRAPGDAEVWALTPGEEAVVNWSAHFAPQRTEVAAEVFGEAFDLAPGGSGGLRLEEPALVRQDASGRLSVRRRGRLSGFRS